MKRILLLERAAGLHPDAIDFACYMAKLLGSPLTGAFLEDNEHPGLTRIAAETSDDCALPGAWGQPKLPPADPVIQHFCDACVGRESIYAVHPKAYVSVDDVVAESRFADLLLLRPDLLETGDTDNSPSRLARFVLANAACPVMLIPHSFIVPEEVVFTFDGSRASVFAIKQFTSLFSPAISWKKVKFLLVNDFVQAPAMEEWVAAHYPQAESVFLEGGTTTQLIEDLLPNDQSIVVMGAYSRTAFSRLMKKSNADPLINILLSPVFIAHGMH